MPANGRIYLRSLRLSILPRGCPSGSGRVHALGKVAGALLSARQAPEPEISKGTLVLQTDSDSVVTGCTAEAQSVRLPVCHTECDMSGDFRSS